MMIKKFISLCVVGAFSFSLSAQKSSATRFSYISKDSVETFASSRYRPNSFLRRLFMGSNYRKEWSQPVTVPVFRFSGSGFTIKELGGGMQTKSLQLTDSLGKVWLLRTVDKDVAGAMPPLLRNTLAQRVAQDFTSAAFPYGAQVAGELAHAAGLLTARPQVFFVAEDAALGEFQSIFVHTLCTLEERDPGFDSTENSFTVLKNITQDHQYKIQQKILLKGRVLDMLTADWDRHADNWRWGLKDSADLHYYYAIPRDRDWVFYQSKGLIPKLAGLTNAMRHLVNFAETPKNIKDLSWKAWLFDKTFLNEMNRMDWEEAIKDVQESLTDKAIETAVQKIPASIYELNGITFISTLKNRRNELKKEVMKYYRFLTEEVIINGSEQDERFFIHSNKDSLVITVYKKNSGAASTRENIYQRTFLPEETYLITMNGLGGSDDFQVDEKTTSKIRLKMVGGAGSDSYDIKGDIRVKAYDEKSENNIIINEGGAKIHFR